MSNSSDNAAGTPAVNYRWTKAAARLGVSVLILGVLFVVYSSKEIWERVGEFLTGSLSAWAGALGLFLTLHIFGALKWRLFLSLAGAHITPLSAIRFYGSGLFANLCLPSLIGGDVLRAGLAMAETDKKEAVLFGGVVDRFADLVALACLVTIGGVLATGAMATLDEASVSGTTILIVYLAIMACGMAGLAFVLRPRVLRRMPRRISRHGIQTLRATRALRQNPAEALFGFCACLVIQAGFVLINVNIGQAMGIDLDLRVWLLLWPLAKIIAMMPISFGGLGVREFAFAGLIAPFGVAREVAIAESLVWQSVLIVGGMVAGAFAVITRKRGA